jgi:hypothetical protein
MKTMVGLLVAILCVAVVAARADLCPKCADGMYTMDAKQCPLCKEGLTGSGAFKLCKACGAKLGQCERCGAALAAPKAVPAQVAAADRQTAEQALNNYLAVLSKGGTVADLAPVVTAPHLQTYADDQGRSDRAKKFLAEDRYAKLAITKVEGGADRLVVYATANYKPAWIKKEEDELKATGMDPAEAKGGTVPLRLKIKLTDPTMDVQHPFHKEGTGFVAFLLKKEGNQWRYHGGVASAVPLEVVRPE